MRELTWFALHVAPGREFLARDELRMSGYRCQLPTIDKTVRVSGRSKREKIVQEALFARYIFANIIPWREMRLGDPKCLKKNGKRLITGVLGMKGADGVHRAHVFSEKEMLAILENAALAQLVPVSESLQKRLPAIGEIAHITGDNLFKGMSGPVAKINGREAQVALQIFNAVRLVSVPVKNVEKAA
jgi:transcription antitermination factor NusG